MRDTKLEIFPTTDELLALPTEERKKPQWKLPFDAAVDREYITAWFGWHMNNGQSAEVTSTELCKSTAGKYLKNVGNGMPWLAKALNVLDDFDPAAKKPFVTPFLTQITHALSSASVFQAQFKKDQAYNPRTEVRMHIEKKMARAARSIPPVPLLFDALSNGYEHIFTFLVRMFSEFENRYERKPVVSEFDDLNRQLFVKLGKEARLSRRDNLILEDHFAHTPTFFSFSDEPANAKMDINGPTPEQQELSWLCMRHRMSGREKDEAMNKQKLGKHFGCPAALARYDTTHPIHMIFEEVSSIVKMGFYGPEVPCSHAHAAERRQRDTVKAAALKYIVS